MSSSIHVNIVNSDAPPDPCGGIQVLTDVSSISHILTPGSSLHPTFLLIVDGVFTLLLLVLLVLAVITSSAHFFALIVITVGLWASTKWFVNELRRAPLEKELDSFERKDK